MPEIDNIIFDLGGVLLNLDQESTLNAFAAMGMDNIRDLFGVGHAASFFRDYEVGKIGDEEFIDILQAHLHGSAGRDAIIAGWNAMLLDFPKERMDWLSGLRLKYRLFLFSNTNGIHLEAFQKIYADSFGQGSLDDHFEKAYYSHLAGVRKPDLAAYRLVVGENNLDPSKTVFIDDALVNVEAARQAGLQGIHLQAGISVLDLGL